MASTGCGVGDACRGGAAADGGAGALAFLVVKGVFAGVFALRGVFLVGEGVALRGESCEIVSGSSLRGGLRFGVASFPSYTGGAGGAKVLCRLRLCQLSSEVCVYPTHPNCSLYASNRVAAGSKDRSASDRKVLSASGAKVDTPLKLESSNE